MPKGCNGLELIDKTKDFCKENCKWVKKAHGRSVRKPIPGVKAKKKKSALTRPKTICLSLERQQLEFIKKQAMRRSLEAGELVEANDLIREALVEAFPYNKQKELFV